MSKGRKTIHVVSNSHWDREWGYPFEETRLLLIDFMDNLLELLDNDKEFHSFTMDSQTLCVEDYLELRPEKRATIEKHVKSGRFIVGPWYSLPEEYLVSTISGEHDRNAQAPSLLRQKALDLSARRAAARRLCHFGTSLFLSRTAWHRASVCHHTDRYGSM